MTSKRDRNDFINFIIDATQDDKLAGKFLGKKSAKDIYDFFQKEGYKDIPFNDCKDIYKASKNMTGRGVSNARKPVDTSDVVRKGY